jgi:hypothetical protein
MGESDRKAMLDEYKKKIYSQYWTRTGNPRSVSNAEVRKIIGEFEKVSVFPSEMIDLLLFRVETMTDWASQFGGAPDADYNASSTSFEKALKLMEKNKLHDHFKDCCVALFQADNLDYWYIEDLESLYESYFPQ